MRRSEILRDCRAGRRLAGASAPAARAEAKRARRKRVCLSAAETREEIKNRHLREPFAVLKHAAQRLQVGGAVGQALPH